MAGSRAELQYCGERRIRLHWFPVAAVRRSTLLFVKNPSKLPYRWIYSVTSRVCAEGREKICFSPSSGEPTRSSRYESPSLPSAATVRSISSV